MTKRPPSRTHLAAAGCLAAKLFQKFIGWLLSAVFRRSSMRLFSTTFFRASQITRTRPMIQKPSAP